MLLRALACFSNMPLSSFAALSDDGTLSGVPASTTTGDYNGDGSVNALDYQLWRETFGNNVADAEIIGANIESLKSQLMSLNEAQLEKMYPQLSKPTRDKLLGS